MNRGAYFGSDFRVNFSEFHISRWILEPQGLSRTRMFPPISDKFENQTAYDLGMFLFIYTIFSWSTTTIPKDKKNGILGSLALYWSDFTVVTWTSSSKTFVDPNYKRIYTQELTQPELEKVGA